jgi:hypothetical protein
VKIKKLNLFYGKEKSQEGIKEAKASQEGKEGQEKTPITLRTFCPTKNSTFMSSFCLPNFNLEFVSCNLVTPSPLTGGLGFVLK